MERAPRPAYERLILVCCNERMNGEASCGLRKSAALFKKLKEMAKSRGIDRTVRVTKAMCLGPCEKGPNVCVMPENAWYHGVGPEDLERLLDLHGPPVSG